MTHYWYYIDAGATIDSTTKFYKVGVGTSKQCQRDFSYLARYAADHGHYLSVINAQSSDFFMRVLDSIGKTASSVRLVMVRDLVRSIRQSTDVPLNPDALHNQHHLNVQINLEYRISCRKKKF